MKPSELKKFLDEKVERYNNPNFIEDDPISLPHQFKKLQDIEIIGFWVAMIAWGRRSMIIRNGQRLVDLMDGAPYDFMVNHEEKDREAFLDFKHRTFQPTDTLWFLEYLQQYYQENDSMELAFAKHLDKDDKSIKNALIGFHNDFFASDYAPKRTRKHVATPARKSSCKRLCMFMRWMVRQDNTGVDFGLWKNISPSQLMMPLDVHVDRVARCYNLLKRKQRDWKAVEELTANLRRFDAEDPVKYDYALFGLGVMDK